MICCILHIPLHIAGYPDYRICMSAIDNPLEAPTPEEVPLNDAPLVRVIAQLRFPEILSVEQREFVAPFQEATRSRYPVLRQEQTHRASAGAGGVAKRSQESPGASAIRLGLGVSR